VIAEATSDAELTARAFVALPYEVGFALARYERGLEWCRHAEDIEVELS
jgi:hypothetical protein